jgi:hypothetical protein
MFTFSEQFKSSLIPYLDRCTYFLQVHFHLTAAQPTYTHTHLLSILIYDIVLTLRELDDMGMMMGVVLLQSN